MKSLTKKALMLALAIAVVCSFAVFAASDITGTSASLGEDNASVTVDYTAPDSAAQVTILVFKTANSGDAADTVNAEPVINSDGTTNIVYIDQKANKDSLNFSLRSTDGDGTYKVLIGGTGVAEAATAEFVKASAVTPTTFTVSGTVGTMVNFGGDDLQSFTDMFAPYMLVLKYDSSIDDFETISETTIDVSSINPDEQYGYVPFSVEGLEFGETYAIYIGRPGVCMRPIIINPSVNADVDTGAVELWGTDANDDTVIDGGDISFIIAVALNYNGDDWDNTYIVNCDANADTAVDGGDISIVIDNASKFDNYTITFGE